MRNEPVIAISNLNHYYGRGALRRQILFDINLEIYPGEIVIMTGPSGSGKTTLLSLIGGLRSVQEGSLKFLGVELSGASQTKLVQIRRSIGYIFQAHNLLGFLTARQNVQMAVELNEHVSQEEAIAQSQAMLQSVGLESRIDYYPDNMSGGQKQRIAIARALVNNPPLVLADEPTAALDKQSGRDVVEIMQRLAKEQGTSILLVTHDNRILDIADRIVEMEDGILARDSQTAIISYDAGAWTETQ
ncbi:MAG: DevA family ABC transporter ATP-binding protein [Trichormus sp.]